jgi:hypothetical protein
MLDSRVAFDACKPHLVGCISSITSGPHLEAAADLTLWQKPHAMSRLSVRLLGLGGRRWCSCSPRKDGKISLLAAYALYRLLTDEGQP